MDDVRYSEFVFLRAIAKGAQEFEFFWSTNPEQLKAVGLGPPTYVDMAVTLLEELYVRFDDQAIQLFVANLRNELAPNFAVAAEYRVHQWHNPREAIRSVLTAPNCQRLRITYRGLRRIEELRELLTRDRIFEPFGVLLDLRYLHRDIEAALRLDSSTPVSVLCADLDNFKRINSDFGYGGGDAVMKGYLEVVRDSLGLLGTGYRGRGDEVFGLIVGQGHERAVELCDKIRAGVQAMRREYKGTPLPEVTTSIGLATTPPEQRTPDLETLAGDRNRRAKADGKNRVVGSA